MNDVRNRMREILAQEFEKHGGLYNAQLLRQPGIPVSWAAPLLNAMSTFAAEQSAEADEALRRSTTPKYTIPAETPKAKDDGWPWCEVCRSYHSPTLHAIPTPEPKADWRKVPVDAEMFIAGLKLLVETHRMQRMVEDDIYRLAKERTAQEKKATSNA